MEIRWRRSFASPRCFRGGQLTGHQPQTYRILPKSLDLYLDVCQNAVDLLNRDREPDRPPVNRLPAFLASIKPTDV
ncbi:MAG TPA: hypothetical protein VLA67_09930 [Nitrospiraceae bacterium]|nr:hypothetical protein [Nitrospiraceae bacterium]